jgi:small subunit ribosomal protein S17
MDNTQLKQNGARILSGQVVSIKNKDTLVVEVTNITLHPLYRKPIKKTKRYSVQNNLNDIKIGEKVRIIETRPISKTKHFKLVERINN